MKLTDICYSHKHHAASTHADVQSASEWQSPSQPGQRETKSCEKKQEESAARHRQARSVSNDYSAQVNLCKKA